MVMTYEQELSLETIKHEHKMEFANQAHKNTMDELAVQLKIAEASQ